MTKKLNNIQDLEFRTEWLLSHHKGEKDIKTDEEGDEYIVEMNNGFEGRIYLPINIKKTR